MQKHVPVFVAILSALSFLATPACSDRGKRAEKVVVIPASNPPATPGAGIVNPPVATAVFADPFVEISATLQRATFEAHDGLSVVGDRMNRAVTDQVFAWKTAGHATATAAEDKLTAARDDFTEKLRQLSLSTVETWASAKNNAMAALKGVQIAYGEVLRETPKT